jgi:Caspase domain
MNHAALLIANSRYQGLPPLGTPLSDGRILAERFNNIGFDTTLVEDVDMRSMNRSISEFKAKVDKLPPYSSVLLYFAGHGNQSDGENYLMPVDFDPTVTGGWKLHSLTLSILMEELCWRSDQQKLIALDACRTNGIKSGYRSDAMGLCGVSKERYSDVHETMILYAAGAGQIARDGGDAGSSPFCRAMLDALHGDGEPLVTLVPKISRNVRIYTGGDQTPWSLGNLIELAPEPFWRARDNSGPNAVAFPIGPIPTDVTVVAPIARNAIDAEVAGKGHLIHKFKAKDTSGEWAYYFVLVEPPMETAFLKAIEGEGSFDIEQYGAVVASCYGEAPTPEIRAYLKERYGFDI